MFIVKYRYYTRPRDTWEYTKNQVKVYKIFQDSERNINKNTNTGKLYFKTTENLKMREIAKKVMYQ